MNALVIRLSSAGDVLLTADAVKALKKKGFNVHFVTRKEYSFIAETIGADKVYKLDLTRGNRIAINAAANKISGIKYDRVIDLQANPKSILLASKIKCSDKRRIKKHNMIRRFMVMFKWFMKTNYSVKDDYAAACGVSSDLKPEILNLKLRKRQGRLRIVLHAGAKWPLKRWPYYKELAEKLAADKRFVVTITGLKDEVDNYDEMNYSNKSGINNMIGRSDLKQLFTLIKQADIFVGNDTVAAHIAGFYGVPAIVTMGPTVSNFGFVTSKSFNVLEKRLLCRPCSLHGGTRCPVGDFRCMNDISAGDVIKEIKRLVSKAGK